MSDQLRVKRLRSEGMDQRVTMNVMEDNKRYDWLTVINKQFIKLLFDYRVETKVYAKDSMDRFGDDLTEEVLQYLPIYWQTVRLECVSKQWRRLMYQKQSVLHLSGDNFINYNFTGYSMNEFLAAVVPDSDDSDDEELPKDWELKSLEKVLKKCPNITSVVIEWTEVPINSEVMSMIGQYCQHLKTLTFKESSIVKPKNLLPFFREYGHKLEEVYVDEGFDSEYNYKEGEEEVIKQFLKYCKNLKIIKMEEFFDIFDNFKQLFPKLEQIISHFNLCFEDVVKMITGKICQKQKTLKVSIYYETKEELKTRIEFIARFENLKQLRLRIDASEDLKDKEPIDESLSLIGQKCTKISQLDLSIDRSVPISDRFFDVISEFKAIHKLKVELHNKTVLSGSVESFKHCEQLYDIDITSSALKEDFFENIASFVPKLKTLSNQSQKSIFPFIYQVI